MMIKKHGQGFLESFVSNNINWWYSYTGWMMDVWGKWTYGTIAFLICVSRYVIWDPAYTGVWEKKRTQGAHQPTLRATIQKFNLINQYHTLFFLYSISNSPRPFKTQACLRKRTQGAHLLTKAGSKQASKQRSGEAPVAHFKLSVR